jgi:hypothetical protein
MGNTMVKEHSLLKTGVNLWGNGKMGNITVKEHSLLKVGVSSWGNGKMVINGKE